MSQGFAKRLLRWYDRHGRKNLPWQDPISPYRVWISEIMLQQTQVETVIPYFERFMARFPELPSLAQAPQDEVLHLWTGLGYYARARNLHRCAQVLIEQYQGDFPKDVEAISQLPGIGPSTAAAITSIAFNQPTAILDGNVKRVLARHRAIAGWPGQSAVAQQLWQAAHQSMAHERCRDYTQAIMDLGATLCTRARPQCEQCPISIDCLAYQQDAVALYPGKKPAKTKPIKSAYLLLVQAPEGEILLQQRPPQGIWGGLWCLPELPLSEPLEQHIALHFGQTQGIQPWQGWRHTFSHYHFDIQPVLVKLAQRPAAVAESNNLWYNPKNPQAVGLAAPVKALLAQLSAA